MEFMTMWLNFALLSLPASDFWDMVTSFGLYQYLCRKLYSILLVIYVFSFMQFSQGQVIMAKSNFIKENQISINTLADCITISLLSYVVIKNVTMGPCASNGILIQGCQNVRIGNCTITNTGLNRITILRSSSVAVTITMAVSDLAQMMPKLFTNITILQGYKALLQVNA